MIYKKETSQNFLHTIKEEINKMLKLTLEANGENSGRDLVQLNPTNAEKAALLAQMELSKAALLNSFSDDWEITEED